MPNKTLFLIVVFAKFCGVCVVCNILDLSPKLWMLGERLIPEYASISGMYCISCTRYLQVSLFWLYVRIKVGELALFCMCGILLFFCCFSLYFYYACTQQHHGARIAIVQNFKLCQSISKFWCINIYGYCRCYWGWCQIQNRINSNSTSSNHSRRGKLAAYVLVLLHVVIVMETY